MFFKTYKILSCLFLCKCINVEAILQLNEIIQLFY